jgi:hypothetical protein
VENFAVPHVQSNLFSIFARDRSNTLAYLSVATVMKKKRFYNFLTRQQKQGSVADSIKLSVGYNLHIGTV